MPRNITLRIVGDTVQRSKSRAGVQGEGNITKLICCFDSTWDGLAKSLTFWNADIANPVTQLLTESKRTGDREYTVLFPAEPLELAGKCVVTIDGAQDGVRAKTLAVSFDVAPAPSTDSAKDPAAPTPTQAEQLQKEMEAVQNDIAAVTNMTVEAVGLKAGASPTVKKEMADGAIRMTFGIPAGEKGSPGNGIRSIERTSGSGEPGTRDEYTITMTDGTTSVFYVYNGADGTGSGEGGTQRNLVYVTPGDGTYEEINRCYWEGTPIVVINGDDCWFPIVEYNDLDTTFAFGGMDACGKEVRWTVDMLSNWTYTERDNLPEVSEADDGKILQVVDGSWKPVDLPVAEGGAY